MVTALLALLFTLALKLDHTPFTLLTPLPLGLLTSSLCLLSSLLLPL